MGPKKNHIPKDPPSKEEQEEHEVARHKLHVREMERKATFESTQSEIRRQKDQLQHLRRENKELRSTAQQLAKGASTNSEAFQVKEEELLSAKAFQLRRTYDDTKRSNGEKKNRIAKMQEKLAELRVEGSEILPDNSPMAQKIRELENRLDKALIKHNEAMAIRRTYEQIVKRLQEERVGFDNQLAAIEKTLKTKERDYTELENMAHDAHHAKEIAKAQVQQFKAAYAEERRQRKKELDERRQYVHAQMAKSVQQDRAAKQKAQKEEQQNSQKQEEEERRKKETMQSTSELRTEEELERLQQYAEAYKRIKEVTDAKNVKDVIHKFMSQQDTFQSLVDLRRDIETKMDALEKDRVKYRKQLEDAKYSGSGQLGSRRIVDEFETHLAEAKASLSKEQKNFERLSHLHIGVKAGIEHLAEKLSTYQAETTAPAMTDATVLDVLHHCESKLQMLVEEAVTGSESIDEMLANADIKIPDNNRRVADGLVEGDDEDEKAGNKDANEENEDDPHDRATLKSMSISAVDRENKKNRKKNRKKDEE